MKRESKGLLDLKAKGAKRDRRGRLDLQVKRASKGLLDLKAKGARRVRRGRLDLQVKRASKGLLELKAKGARRGRPGQRDRQGLKGRLGLRDLLDLQDLLDLLGPLDLQPLLRPILRGHHSSGRSVFAIVLVSQPGAPVIRPRPASTSRASSTPGSTQKASKSATPR